STIALGSIFTPGLIDDATVTDLKYVPFEDAGFIRTSVDNNSPALSTSFSGSKDTRPIGVWMIPNLSTRKAIFPFFTSSIALVTLGVTVPDLGLGINPRGPRIRPI